MKKLTKIRLINWYHIHDETLPIEGSVLFMGDNGTGKSTLLDAIQFVLVADLSMVRFNQAANEQAARTLQGYTRWMTNAGSGPQSHEYNRLDCTSYILLEFSEKSTDRESVFTVGAVIDSFKDGRDPKRLHFYVDDCDIGAIPVFRDNSRVLLPTIEFRRLLCTRKGFFGSQEPGPFRENLLTRLGRLSPDFTKVLVKAQAFKPLGQVQQFVMDFLLDPKPLETGSLQANLASYKALELKAKSARERVAQLEKIHELGIELCKIAEERELYRYLEVRAEAGLHEAATEEASRLMGEVTAGIESAAANLTRMDERITRNDTELGSVSRALFQNTAYVESMRIRAELDRVGRDIFRVESDRAAAHRCRDELKQIREQMERLSVAALLRGDSAEDYREFAYEARRLRDETKETIEKIKLEGTELEKRLSDLKKGIRPYPKEATTLKNLITDRLGCEVMFLCECLEVTDEKWQAAVEGYLNTRRFDIILAPKYFKRALALYEETKRQLGIHGVGLVDCEKVTSAKIPVKPGSLAELVTSKDSAAKAYADFVLGDLIRCESEQDLRKFNRSITPTCMVYQNYAARQTPFYVLDSWYIGSRGRDRMIAKTEGEIAQAVAVLQTHAATLIQREKIVSLAVRAEEKAAGAARLDALTAEMAALEDERTRTEAHLASIDTAEVKALEAREKELRDEKESLRAHRDDTMTKLGALRQQKIDLEKKRDESARATEQAFLVLASEFSGEQQRLKTGIYDSRYHEELKERPPQKIIEVFSAQRKGRETQKIGVLDKLIVLRSDYNNQFGFGAPALGEDLSPYLQELEVWRTSHLPEYEQKILHAKESALQQLMEDVVHKLRENLDLIPTQFEQINRALKGFHFGFDQYQFVYGVKREYQAFSELIREAAKYEREPLFETDWRQRFRDGGALEALFENLVNGSSTKVEEELKHYSDYRQYYDYDLKILHGDGTESLYSRVNRWKSGGETQAPYYIAVLASMYRLYRLEPEQVAKQRGTIGLVLLDEAFNKMDEDRLKATLQFTRRLGLQLVMATPKERAEFIIPHVESCWLVGKDPQTGHAYIEDFHQDLSNTHAPA